MTAIRGRHSTLDSLREEIVACRRCPRLTAWREQVARDKVERFAADTYWGRPVPGWGDPDARLVIVGLAPAAHGANRTGRMFTGDKSGDWLYRALFKSGFANQPAGEHRDDGLRLIDAWVTAPVRCAPPANKPAPAEFAACHDWFVRELALLTRVRVLVGLGRIGFDQAFLTWCELHGGAKTGARPKFGHGAVVELEGGAWLIGSFHPSQQNTFTGKLNETMFDAVWARAKELLNKK